VRARVTPLSKTAGSRLVRRLEESYDCWRQQDLAEEHIVYLYLVVFVVGVIHSVAGEAGDGRGGKFQARRRLLSAGANPPCSGQRIPGAFQSRSVELISFSSG